MDLPSSHQPGSFAEADVDDGVFDQGSNDAARKGWTKRLILDLLGRWYWVALGLVLGILASLYYLSKAPETFSAAATLLIKQQTATLMSRDQIDEIDVRSNEGLNTTVERMRRFEFLERVASRAEVRDLDDLFQPPTDWRPAWLALWFDGGPPALDPAEEGTKSPPPPPVALAGHIAAWMQVSIRTGTRLVDVRVTHHNPEVAMTLANAIAQEYVAEVISSATDSRTSSSDTLLGQSEEVRARLQDAESAVAIYQRAIALHASLEEGENNVSELSRRYLPKHPTMIEAVARLSELKSQFLDEFNFATQAPADEAYWQTVSGQITAFENDPEAHLRLARQLLLARTAVLRGEINSQMAVFNSMLTRMEETNVNLLGEAAGAEIHNPARLPGGPSSPDRQKAMANGGVGGLAIGLAFALLLVYLDNKFNTVAQTEQETGRPVLAAIAEIEEAHLRKALRAYTEKHPDERQDPQRDLWDPRLVFRPGTSHTNYAEMFRVLRASITLLGDEKHRWITAFSSALPYEGKSLVSSNFALAAAGQGRRTLLIDLDLRRPRIHRIFGVLRSTQGPGITEWLAGLASLEEVIHQDSGASGLDLILSGTRAADPGELLDPVRIRLLLAEAGAFYDTIVLDTAPLLPVPDTRVIAPLVHNFALVVRAHFAPKGAVHRTLELLQSGGTQPSGLVLNCFKETRRLIGQNYSYGGYRFNRYGRPYQYGYGASGAYGSDETARDDAAAEDEILRRPGKKARGRHRS